MAKSYLIINNEQGSAILLAMLILAVLTIIGVSSTNTSTIELQIVRNERIYQQNFYQAEAAAMEAAQKLEGEADGMELKPLTTSKFIAWLYDETVDLDDISVIFLKADNSIVYNNNNVKIAANALPIVNNSLDPTKKNMYPFSIYGISEDGNGQVIIKIGYKKRY